MRRFQTNSRTDISLLYDKLWPSPRKPAAQAAAAPANKPFPVKSRRAWDGTRAPKSRPDFSQSSGFAASHCGTGGCAFLRLRRPLIILCCFVPPQSIILESFIKICTVVEKEIAYILRTYKQTDIILLSNRLDALPCRPMAQAAAPPSYKLLLLKCRRA